MVSELSEKKSFKQNDVLPQADQCCQLDTVGIGLPSGLDRGPRHDAESRWKILPMALR